MADTLNQIARDKFRRTTSAVPPEIKEATTRRRDAPSTETNLSRSAGGDVFDEFKAGFGVDNLGCGASTKTGIQMCPTLGTDSCFGTASSSFVVNYRKHGRGAIAR